MTKTNIKAKYTHITCEPNSEKGDFINHEDAPTNTCEKTKALKSYDRVCGYIRVTRRNANERQDKIK